MLIRPKKSLGQNFLIDKNIRKKIISSATFDKLDVVLEIGSGRGEVTQSIASEVKKVYALEMDSRLLGILENNLKGFDNVKIIHQDILKFDFGEFFKKAKFKIKIFGNIPYYITTPIIEYLFKYRHKISAIFLTVQKEFAERAIASPGSKKYGSLSCFIQYYTKPEILFTIKKNSFAPPPKVDSVFLKLEVLETPSVKADDEDKFFKIIRASFNQRRKTLRNSLEGVIEQQKLEIFFKRRRVNPDIRPEDLSLQDFTALANT